MVRTVKSAVHDEKLEYDITIRRAKSGNVILEISKKEHADNLAAVLKARMGDTVDIR